MVVFLSVLSTRIGVRDVCADNTHNDACVMPAPPPPHLAQLLLDVPLEPQLAPRVKLVRTQVLRQGRVPVVEQINLRSKREACVRVHMSLKVSNASAG
jgi:hypothetical protein